MLDFSDALFIGNHTTFLVHFGFYLHECVFQKVSKFELFEKIFAFYFFVFALCFLTTALLSAFQPIRFTDLYYYVENTMITFLSLRELEILPDWLEIHASNSSFYNFRWKRGWS